VIAVALGFASARVLAPERLFPAAPGVPHWTAALACWSALAALGLLAFAVASRDPAR
jgi:hypothetical protein